MYAIKSVVDVRYCTLAGIEREQDKIKRDAKEAARKGEKAAVKAMAKNIVMSNKAIERMHVTKANLNSVLVTLQTQSGASTVVFEPSHCIRCRVVSSPLT